MKKIITKTIFASTLGKNVKIKYVNVEWDFRKNVLEEVRQALWKKAHYLYEMDIDTLKSKRIKLKSITLTGKEIDRFINRLINKTLVFGGTKSKNKQKVGKVKEIGRK